MVQYEIRGGIDSFALYKAEAAYGTDPGTWTTGALHFGIETSIKPTPKRNLTKVRGMSGTLPAAQTAKTSRDAQQIFAGKYEVGIAIEFQPQTFDFMEFVFGSKSGSDPYYYPQETASTESDKKKYTQAPSFSLMVRKDFGGSTDAQDKVWIHSGCIVNTMTLRAAMGEAVSVSLDAIGAVTTASVTSVATAFPYTACSSADVYNFSHASVTYAGAPVTNIIEAFDFTIGNTAEILYGLGSYVGKTGVWKARDVSVTLDLTNEGTQFMDDFMGAATSVTDPVKISAIVLTLSKSASINMVITLTNLKIADDDAGLEYGEVVKEKITLEAEVAYCVENQA